MSGPVLPAEPRPAWLLHCARPHWPLHAGSSQQLRRSPWLLQLPAQSCHVLTINKCRVGHRQHCRLHSRLLLSLLGLGCI